ncbi:MAG: beta-1,6-N-acetylglucosaminyltransferase [Bacteroidota bacterium]|nr:beta-1,6-N-acetylglucosaminyltransferase [Bacteroidota bacterium]
MEKAFIILAHKNPQQVARLISSLDDSHSTFFLHFDKNVNSAPFIKVFADNKNVVMVKNEYTFWGSFGIVQATLNAMKSAINHYKTFDFISLISGQHYPIKSNEYINNFLSRSPYHIFMEYSPIPNHHRWQPRGGMFRIDKYFFGMKGYERTAAKAVNFLSSKIKMIQRNFPQTMKPYGGSQWWTMNRYAVKYILDFVKKNEAYCKFHRFTFAPDELFFHNIVLNADDERIKNSITNNNLLYLRWSNLRKGHPDILQQSDIQNIISSDALFARKFDVTEDADVLDLIDEHRKQMEGVEEKISV